MPVLAATEGKGLEIITKETKKLKKNIFFIVCIEFDPTETLTENL